MKKEMGIFKQAIAAAEASGDIRRVERDGVALHEYPDYETYVKVQTDGNKAKLKKQFVKESHVVFLSEYLSNALGSVSFGLCHGTRAGREQAWFARHLGAANIVGTEISDTADQFPNTVQWDFHDDNPDWAGRADFVYSNSWDHAFEPERAFAAWFRQLRPGGLMLLDHTKNQAPKSANALDPFGAELPALQAMLDRVAGAEGAVFREVLDCTGNPQYRARVVVYAKS